VDDGVFDGIPTKAWFFILADVFASWVVSLAYILLELSLGYAKVNNIVRRCLELIFAPVRVPIYLVMVPIEMIRHHSFPPPAALLWIVALASLYALIFVLTLRRLKARRLRRQRYVAGSGISTVRIVSLE
jgi:hypothetical protein